MATRNARRSCTITLPHLRIAAGLAALEGGLHFCCMSCLISVSLALLPLRRWGLRRRLPVAMRLRLAVHCVKLASGNTRDL